MPRGEIQVRRKFAFVNSCFSSIDGVWRGFLYSIPYDNVHGVIDYRVFPHLFELRNSQIKLLDQVCSPSRMHSVRCMVRLDPLQTHVIVQSSIVLVLLCSTI
jgi:hypothetical protein